MAYYGRYRRRRYSYRRRYRNYNRRRYTRSRYTRYKKSPYNRVFMAKRLAQPRDINENSLVTEVLNNGDPIELQFDLAGAQEYTDFTNLYNEYKIRAVKVSFIPLANVSNMEQSAFSPLLYSAIDTNGNTSGSLTSDQIRQYQTVKWTPYNRIHSRYFYPRPGVATTGSGSLVDEQMTPSGKQPWVNTTFTGLKYRSLLIAPPLS